MKAVQSVLAILLALVIVSFSQAETIYVDDDNVAGPWDGTPGRPYQHIQDGIDAASNGDTVLVRDGIYRGACNVNLDFKGKAITVTSEGGPDNCIIDCEDVEGTRGFIFHSGEGLDSILDGFTIQNGLVGNGIDDAARGGGIMCYDSSPTIANNIIRRNRAHSPYGFFGGGGIFCWNSSPAIVNNTIVENEVSEGSGGGIYCYEDSSPMIANNLIIQNEAYRDGGGIYCHEHSSPVIMNNTITQNMTFLSEGGGGGIYCASNSSPTVTNTIVRDNDPVEEIYADVTIDITYSNIQGGWPGEGNIDADPKFRNVANRDYRLRDYSLCIGAGIVTPDMPDEDIEGNPRPNPPASNPDMGAYENGWDVPQPIYVDDDNVAGPWEGTLAHPYQRIQDGIDAAWHGNTVLVRDGMYKGAGNVNLDFKGKAVTVRSEDGPDNCIIDCEDVEGTRGFVFSSGEGLDSILDGFTIQNGLVGNGIIYDADRGGGIVCYDSSPTITNNIIRRNRAVSPYGFFGGGGIFCWNSSPAIVSNTIVENEVSEGSGGGIYCYEDSSPMIASNLIIQNEAYRDGGGIYCHEHSSPVIINNTITQNMTIVLEGGGGIHCASNSSPTVTNTIVRDNDPKEIYADATIDITYCNIQGGWPGEGNIDVYPAFVDAANDDYHLEDSSPCIGRGNMTPDVPDEDIEGNPRPNPPGSNPDMGAYENPLPAPSVSTTLIIQAFSPVDLEVTDPKLRTINKDASTIPYAVYIQTDLNGDGDPDDGVFIPEAVFGNYSIQVTPETGANPTDTYTLDVSYGDETVRLAENVPIGDIPADPYIFFYPLLDMKQGWNLISLPLQPPDTDPGAVLSSISGSYNSVWAFEPGAGWTVYAPGVPIGLERMEPDRGYWIKMDEPGSLIVQGTDPEQTDISLTGGEWNLVGYSSRTSRNAENCMSQVEDSINSVWEYDAKDETWFIYMLGGPSDLGVMRPGVGYWIKADQECVWDVNATTQLAAPALALKSSRGFTSADRPEIPYMVWGSVEIDDVKVTGKDTTYHTPIAVTSEIDGKVQYSCILRASDRCGDFYVLYVPSYMDSSAQPELYVRMDGNVVKAFSIPMGRPGEIIRFDLSIRIAPKVGLLRQNYPNPFNPDTWIPYQLREDNDVVIMIYASTGRLVRTLGIGRKPAGFYTDREKAAYWDGKNEAGEHVASGVYFYSIKAGDLTATRKMVIVR